MTNTTQTELLHERVRRSVLNLELLPGERLSERGLEAMFGASRTPARAALVRLETDGLVRREGRGWIVAPIDIDQVHAVAELREAVEVAAVRLAAERASDAAIDALVTRLDAARPLEADPPADGVRAGGEFHVELAALSANPLLADAVASAMTRLERTRYLEVRTAQSRLQAWREHEAIARAVRARDADEAARLVAAHIRETDARLVAHLTAERRRFRASGLAVTGPTPA